MPNSESIELKLRLKRSKQQGEGKLLDYMMNHPTLSSTEAVLSACRAYWMPLALARAGENNAAVLREVGWRAVGELEMQIQLIKRVLQLEETTSATSSPAFPVPVPVAVEEAEQVELSGFSVPNTSPLTMLEDIDDNLGVNDF